MFDAIKAKKRTKRARKKKNKIIMEYIEVGIKEACARGRYSVILDKDFKRGYFDFTQTYHSEYYNVDELDDKYKKDLQKSYTISSIPNERKIKISWD